MNLDSLQKDKSIIEMLKQLRKRIGFDEIVLNDYWEIDLCAIGISDISYRYLVYISTCDRKEGQYYVELENLNKEKPTDYNTVGKYENVSILEVERLVLDHLKISRSNSSLSS